jgi:hypothetical protein
MVGAPILPCAAIAVKLHIPLNDLLHGLDWRALASLCHDPRDILSGRARNTR